MSLNINPGWLAKTNPFPAGSKEAWAWDNYCSHIPDQGQYQNCMQVSMGTLTDQYLAAADIAASIAYTTVTPEEAAAIQTEVRQVLSDKPSSTWLLLVIVAAVVLLLVLGG